MTQLEMPEPGGQNRGLIDGPAGALEAVAAAPETAARGVIVVCHPHPQQGGTLDNKVTYMTARACAQAGFAALRFNYRGVGASAGEYGRGRGELEDARAVRRWARAASGLADGGVAGFSFGAAIALRLAAADGAARLITIGLPVEYFDGVLARPDSDWLAVFGDSDDVIDVDRAIAAVKNQQPAVTLKVMADAGHFLHGRLAELRRLVSAHLATGG